MGFKEWLKVQESVQRKSERLQMGKKDRKPEWAPRPEILFMKKQ